MAITVTVEQLDQQLEFVRKEIEGIRNNAMKSGGPRFPHWATAKIEMHERTIESLRQMRQHLQMGNVR